MLFRIMTRFFIDPQGFSLIEFVGVKLTRWLEFRSESSPIYFCLLVFQAGQERFQSLSQSYYRNVNGVLLLYDISSYSSFENVVRWIEKCPLNRSSILHTMLIGNKVDKSQRVVPRQVAERLADEYQMSFIETSAKTGQNVELAFLSTAQILLDKQVHRENQDRLEEKNIEIQSKSYFKRISKRCC